MAHTVTLLDQPVPHRPVRSYLSAGEAVHDGIELPVYLLYKLRLYVATYRWSLHPLPYCIAVVRAALVCTEDPESKRYWAQKREGLGEGGVAYLSPPEQAEVARLAEKIEADAQDIEARSRAYREQIEEQEMHAASAISDGTEPGPRTREYARPHSPKRPPIPWSLILALLAVVFLGLVEDFQLTFPILDRMGVDASALALEWERQPLTVIGGVAIALTATAVLLVWWHFLVSHAAAWSTGLDTARPLRSGAKLVGLVILTVVLFLFTLCIANFRHDTAASASGLQGAATGQSVSTTDTGLFFLLLSLLLPAGAAYIQFRAGKSPYWQARADFRKQLALHNETEAQFQLPPARRADVLDALRTKLAECEQEKARLEARRQALTDFLTARLNEYRKRLDDEEASVAAFSRTLLSALQTDCIFFVRAANRAHATHLVPTEPVSLSPQSPGETFTDSDDAPFQPEPAPRYRASRPLLTNGHRREL